MKLLCSDYDGTIKPYNNLFFIKKENILKKNINAINDFISSGNIFNITTGRDSEDIMQELALYDIKYSYLTTYNGRVIFDEKNNLLYKKTLEKEFLKELKKVIEFYVTNDDLSIFDYHSITDILDDAIVIYIYSNNLSLIEETKELSKYYPDIIVKSDLRNKRIKITTDINKSDGIKKLLELLPSIDINDVYTIGDAKNDIHMLKDYNGYKLIDNKVGFFNDCNVTTSLNRLIKKLK